MKKTSRTKRVLASLLSAILLWSGMGAEMAQADQILNEETRQQMVLTLGADLSEEQKAYILQYFGVSESDVQTVTVTNADEHAQLDGKVPDEKIGTRTLSCALIRMTDKGGVQVKTAHLFYVSSEMIATHLSTAGVYNCEVLAASPVDVSGTGALTGVMMAYEAVSGESLDPEKKELANEEMVITGDIAEDVGQEAATLVVNDIKIHIVRDGLTEQEQVDAAVDEVVDTVYTAMEASQQASGGETPAKLGDVQRQKLCDFGYAYSQQGYNYSDVVTTLERVTRNVTKSQGIDDPITDTFTTSEETQLDPESILLNTNDENLGEEVVVGSTASVALGDHEAEKIDVFTGEVTLESAGAVSADRFITDTNDVPYKDNTGNYALMDLNGNLLTDAVYTDDFDGECGLILARLSGEDGAAGVLREDGRTAVDFQYDLAEIISEQWAVGLKLTETTDSEYDYYSWGGKQWLIEQEDFYYLGEEEAVLAMSMARDQVVGGREAYGGYLNLRDANGSVTTYDANGEAVATTDMLSDFGEFDSDRTVQEAIEEKTGYYVSSFYGGYASFWDSTRDSGHNYGVVDRYGNIILQADYDSIDVTWESPYSLENNGYFRVRYADGTFGYVMQGDVPTATYSYQEDDAYYYGMTSRVKKEDGGYAILSADGVETDLGTTYENLTELKGSKGMFVVGYTGGHYDLIDWHGNVVISGADGYSISANGNYLIAQDGYSSNTLYLVNGASPVKLSESLGGTQELVEETAEGASLEAYTDDPVYESCGTLANVEGFVEGTDLIEYEGSAGYGVMALDGTPVTEAVYAKITYKDGWLAVYNTDGKAGILTMDGREAVACEYDYVEFLNEQWALLYTLTETTSSDYDFSAWGGGNYQIEQVTVAYLTTEEVSMVSLTRDQFQEAEADGAYLNVRDRSTGAVTTYDSSFTAVASVDYTSDFGSVSARKALISRLEDETGCYVWDADFPDGYSRVYRTSEEGSTEVYGVIDMDGNVVVPVEYEGIESYTNAGSQSLWANGYFCVKQDGKYGYVTRDNTVTCEPIGTDADTYYYNCGMMGYFEKGENGLYVVLAADGTQITCSGMPYGCGRGMTFYYSTDSGKTVRDWHGNILFEDLVYYDSTEDGNYLLVRRDWESDYELYALSGAATQNQETSGTPTQTEAATEPATEAADDAYELLTEAQMLLEEVGLQDDQDMTVLSESGIDTELSSLLTSARAAMVSEGADQSALNTVDSALMLLEAGTATGQSMYTLITTIQGMM